ncbi:MAG: SusC/RagA family TonB-linked outer membrane protein, partial [Gemmatimonadetes bacterium]|nr:SusC/RagA family TonB-linked outer membrane protein [Gemmatimonadota bacterium]
ISPQVAIDANFGIANPVRGYDEFLIQDPLQYFEVIRRSYANAGQAVPTTFTSIYGDPNNPSIPQYIYAHPSTIMGRDAFRRPNQVNEAAYSYPNALIMPGSQGTNWWDAVFGTGETRDVNLAVRGGAEAARYSVGLNYFDQLGTAAYNRYQRGTARVNTDFTAGRFTVGENLSVSFEEAYGGQAGDFFGEGGIIGKNILSQPVVPIYDINGNFASGKSPGLGNNTNPLKAAFAARDNRNTNSRIFGNIFGRLALTDALAFNTSLGINAGTGGTRGFNDITPENSEPNFTNSIFENSNTFSSYTWNNTLNFQQTFAENHNVSLLAGQEAIRGRNRFISGGISSLVSTVVDARYIQDALGDPGTKNVSSSGGVSSLLSFFGKADYNFAERYYVSGTLRRDGSSRLAEGNQWGTFPAFSLGWRVSQEPFMQDNALISNMMLRFGYGITGNQNIASGRTTAGFGGTTGSSFYDIAGADTRVVTGYRQTSIGNPDLRWEENVSTNVGMDLEFLDGNATFVLDLYQRDSKDLLFNPPLPGTAGLADPPIVNVGQMRNRGIDGSIGLRGSFGDAVGWSMDLNASHYQNEIVRIDGQQNFFFGPVGSRFASSITINEVGKPIGAFYGYVKEGTFQTQQEIDALNASARQATGATASTVYQTGAKPGRFRFKDTNGDGRVTALDRTTIGSPHPDFTSGLNLGLNWNNFDLGADLFGSFGNEIYDVQKEFYVFRLFNTNVREDILTDSWTPENPNAKYPRLDVTDDFSRDPSSFYVEDGSYVRLRSLQLGYTMPSGRIRGFDNVRVYVRGENLFTLTGYDGLDPSLPALNASRSGMDISDQARGVDRGTYPTNRTLSMGFGIGF